MGGPGAAGEGPGAGAGAGSVEGDGGGVDEAETGAGTGAGVGLGSEDDVRAGTGLGTGGLETKVGGGLTGGRVGRRGERGTGGGGAKIFVGNSIPGPCPHGLKPSACQVFQTFYPALINRYTEKQKFKEQFDWFDPLKSESTEPAGNCATSFFVSVALADCEGATTMFPEV